MTKTVIGLFDDREEATRAYAALVEEGYARADIDILTNDDADDVPKLAALKQYVKAPDVEVYLEGVRQGGTVITANVVDSAAERAAGILSNFNIVNIGKRVTELKKVEPSLTLSDPLHDDNVIEVIEEELQVGVGEEERGRLRIYNVVTEREVAKNVGLRDETLRVKRRPVNRAVAISPDLFKERSFELVEVDGKRIWEEKNPGTWDQSKAVIKYAWEKVRNAR